MRNDNALRLARCRQRGCGCWLGLVLLLLFLPPAAAQAGTGSKEPEREREFPTRSVPRRFHLGVRAGMLEYRQTASEVERKLDRLGEDVNLHFDDQPFTGAMFVGTPLLGSLSLELGYLTLGQHLSVAEGQTQDAQDLALKTAKRTDPSGSALSFGIDLAKPAGRLWMVGSRAGLLYADATREAEVNGVAATVSKSRLGAYGGLSLSYRLNCQFNLGAGLEGYALGEELTALSLGVQLEYRRGTTWDCRQRYR